MAKMNLPVSVLNLVPIRQGSNAQIAIEQMVELAQKVEALGYERYWVAEHHNTSRLVSSATSILIKHILEHTDHIKVGSGGIMLPNHAPLVVAEQFGTMATIYPDRVDLGLGRAPGTDMMTADALRRSDHQSVYSFPEDIEELLRYFGPESVQGHVRAYPGVGTNIPIYVLGSSTNSAHLAAQLGLPYVFAAHFAPTHLEQAIEIYRREFKPSAYLDKAKMMVCVNLVAADEQKEAEKLATSMYQMFLNIVRGTENPLMPPVESMDSIWTPYEAANVKNMLKYALIGDKQTIKDQLNTWQNQFDVDEWMVTSYIYDIEKQYRSFKILKEIVTEA